MIQKYIAMYCSPVCFKIDLYFITTTKEFSFVNFEEKEDQKRKKKSGVVTCCCDCDPMGSLSLLTNLL
jgi:hypothetical protein